jgi:oligoribonuclease NrnB/cAMP/cGMP phosphodiesterase (DHH superfamily)
MSQQPVICFYHKRCVDGTASAAVVLCKYPQAQAFALGFDTVDADLAEALPLIKPDTFIIYVDNAMNLEQIAGLGNQVLVIDHHVSERVRVEEIARANQNVTFVYDVEESGTTLAWRYFFPEEEVPRLLSYIRDIDIWRNELLPESNYAHLFLSGYRDKPEEVKAMLSEDLNNYLATGKILAEHIEREVEKHTELEPIKIKVSDWEVSAYNVTNHQSKVGNILSLEINAVVVMYTISGGTVRCAIRSVAGNYPTALEVAKALGGGGHEHSSGAGVNRENFFSLILP